jgi:predicted nucleotidyltransferase
MTIERRKTQPAGLSAADRQIARELRQRLAQRLKVEDFRVYGSRARGEATSESDLDVYLVVAELTPALRRWIDEIAWEVGFDNDRVISTLVTTRRGLEQGPFGAQPVVQTIEREGIPV